MSSQLNVEFVRRVVTRLSDLGCETWIFGGWGEEIRGLCRTRVHNDVDLLYPGASFASFDSLFENDVLTEIAGKRFPHKRAFLVDGVMVEIFLVEEDPRGLHTSFWSSVRYDWPADTFTDRDEPHVASKAALSDFRSHHDRVHEPRTEWILSAGDARPA